MTTPHPDPPLEDGPASAPSESLSSPEKSSSPPGQPSGKSVRQPPEKSPDDPRWSDLPELKASDVGRPPPPQRRTTLPLVLFVATCLSTFWVGATDWKPQDYVGSTAQMWQAMAMNWQQGLVYMGAVLAILLTHEMGHFWQTIRHRIPASYPLCIPVPFTLIGTMGAVISMDGMRADRRQIFDIGVAGPIAGLVVAFPILYIGVARLDLTTPAGANDLLLYNPVIVQWMLQWMHPEWAGNPLWAEKIHWVAVSQLNPFFMAGWVGMLITGLNMLPVSQLDGGHTIYALFGRDANKMTRAFTIVAIVYVVLNLEHAAIWTPMLILVILMGIHHPPTADDSVELDDVRFLLGVASMAIPILCFPLLGLQQ